MNNALTAYITKYALTQGILEVPESMTRRYGNALEFNLPGYYTRRAHPSQYHKTKTEAIAKAEEMRLKAIAATKKKLATLERLTFS